MKLSKILLCVLVGLAGLVLIRTHTHAQATPVKQSAVIVDPAAGKTIDQSQQTGIASAAHFASAFEAQKDDRQLREMQASGGNRAGSGSSLDRIELRTMGIDTSLGEPTVPAALRQGETSSKRLRLIQFKGPMKSSWVDQVRAAGDVTVISYIPNNAYIIWLDTRAEQKLARLMEPQGPVQWIGAYHPYYKVPQNLLSLSGSDPIMLRVTVVDQSQDPQAESGAFALGVVKASLKRDGQEIIEMEVPPSAIARIAKLPDVLWIEKEYPKHILDEVQDLVLASQTNQLPFFSPTPPPPVSNGIHYVDWLFTNVAGGMTNFADPSTYPVVDVADTGVDNGTLAPFHPSFYLFGLTNLPSRVVALLPPWISGDPVSQLGCTTRLTDNSTAPFRQLETADLLGHGTFVASIVAGYDAGTNTIDRPTLVMVTTSNTVPVAIPGPFTGTFNCSQIIGASAVVTAAVPNGVTNICGVDTFTNILFTVATNTCPSVTNVVIAFTRVDTDLVSEIRQDMNGFQFGMGVSPFGQISVTRLWGTMESSVFSIGVINGACVPTYHATGLCLNDFVSGMSEAYVFNFARIQNNSWADSISTTGDNGGEYTADSVTYDIAVRDAVRSVTNALTPLNQEFIVVFACNTLLGDAGNQGPNGGFADMRVTAPATAKNVISVGSSVNPQIECGDGGSSLDMYSKSAAGPTADGRFKPEIVAVGAGVVGAIDQLAQGLQIGLTGLSSTNCSIDNMVPFAPFITNSISPDCTDTQTMYTALYTCNSGSSFAAPAVSGAIQLLWWYFQNRLTNELGQAMLQPSPAMAKAYVCNAARYLPITNPQTGVMDRLPSNLQGMGELDLERMFDGVGRVIRDESSPRAIDVPLSTVSAVPQQTYFSQSGQSYELSGQIQNAGLPFRVTLAWTDAPGVPNLSGPELVNDLNLQVTVGGVVYKGNVFAQDHSVTGGTFDNINNLQSVFLPPGQTGTWSVVVTAANIAGKGVPNVGSGFNQDFALVVYNAATNTASDIPNLATNNACQTAIPITQFPFVFTNALNKAVYKNTQPSPSAGKGGIDEFFKIETPDPGVTFSVDTSASSFDSVLSVWEVGTVPETLQSRGECGALEELISQEISSTNNGSSGLSFTADGSNTYFIVVEPQNDGDGGTMVLNVNATGTGITNIPSALDFGQQVMSTTSTPQTVSYQRVFGGAVTINSLAIAGSNPSDFAIGAETCNGRTLVSGGSCAVNIVFTPQAVGLRQATLVINDTATGSPRLIPLSGTGTPLAPLVCLSSGGSLTFPSQLVTTTSTVQSVTITNCGSAPLNISNVSLTGAGSLDFAFVQSPSCTGGPIAPGGFCVLNVTFNPQVAGTRQAALTITHDAAGSPTTVLLQGDAIPLTSAVCPAGNLINFGNTVFVGTTGLVQSVIITNCGTAPLVISSVITTGTNAGDFLIGPSTCGIVATGGTCAVAVTFAPTATGLRTAVLTINDNTPGNPDHISLVGIGSGINCLTTIAVTPTLLPPLLVGIPYNQTLTANGAKVPVNFFLAVGPMPPGLALSTSGVISGIPTKVGQYSFEVGLTDANGCSAEMLYTVFVSCPTISISPSSLPGGIEFTNYGPQTITASGGTPPYTFSQTAGALPAGMTLSSSGVITGTPTSVSSTFTVTVTDSNNCTASKIYTLSLVDPKTPTIPLTVSPSSLPAGVVGKSYTTTLTASGGTAPYTFTALPGSLPGGLTLSSAGTLSGAPSAAGTFNFTVTATDTNNDVGQTNCTMSITSIADLAVSASLSPDPVLMGSNLTCTITVTNLGPSRATGVTITNSLPAGAGFVSASPGCVMVGGTLVCDVGSLAAGASVPLSYTVTNATLGAVSATATVSANETDPNAGNNGVMVFGVVAPPYTVAPNPKAIIDGDGDTVSVTLKGAGTMEVHLVGGENPIDSIVLTDTGATSALTIQVKKARTGSGDGLVNIGSIVSDGGLKSINGKAVNLTGAGIQLGDSLGSVTLHTMVHTALTVVGPIKTVNVGTFDASNITAVKLGSVKLGTVSNTDGSLAFGIQVQQAGGTLSVTNPRLKGKITASSLSTGNFHAVVQ
jgi:uncharacterized repeat protein (TIGR01451 family)